MIKDRVYGSKYLETIKYFRRFDAGNPTLILSIVFLTPYFFRLAEVEKLREAKEPTIPTEFKMERDLNPFVRLDSPQIQVQTGSSSNDEESVCATLREMKNNF